MQLRDIEEFGVPSQVIEKWRDRQGEALLPVQIRALRQGLLGGGHDGVVVGNMLIAAPTSSGKSFCAELAALKAASARQRTLMLFPLKSLAEEKYRLFRQTYGRLGVKCLLVTGDHPDNDLPFARGDYQIALAIYEKIDLLLTTRLDVLQTVGLVVVDEIQTVAEPGRGAVLERLLTKIKASHYRPAIVALSAALSAGAAGALAEWLGATLVDESLRPRDLICGVMKGDEFRYRSFNGAGEGVERLTGGGESADGGLGGLLDRISSDNGPVLVFLKSRADTVRFALEVASKTGWPAAAAALRLLEQEEDSALVRALKRSLEHGVAFHNADLSLRQREIVEHAFGIGEVMVLCSTTTLALGVNLPAETVYLETVKYASGAYGHRPELVPISRAEFDNLSGRAGRLGFGKNSPGKAVVLAQTPFESQTLWDYYIAPNASGEELKSAFHTAALEDWLLHFVVSGLACDVPSVHKALGCTLRAHLGGDGVQWPVERALDELKQAGMLAEQPTGEVGFWATPLGCAVARTGLTVAQAQQYAALLTTPRPKSLLGWVALALAWSGWVPPSGMVSHYDITSGTLFNALVQRDQDWAGELRFLWSSNGRQGRLDVRTGAIVKAALLLEQWADLEPLERLEERFRLHLGQIHTLGDGVAHLVASIGALLEAREGGSSLNVDLCGLAFSLKHGLPVEFRELHRCLKDRVSRTDYAALRRENLLRPDEVAGATDEFLRQVLGSDSKLLTVRQLIKVSEEEVDMQTAVVQRPAGAVLQPGVIEIDGAFESDRYLVRIDGFPVRLTGKSFKYLVKLAWSRLRGDSGWLYKEDIEVGFNQARYLYRLKNEIASSFSSNWPVVENNRLGYYRLKIEPERIRINENNIRNHPDYEVRSLVERQQNGAAVN